MRFVLAIVAFVVAAAMIGVGLAQRTVWAPSSDISVETTVAGGAPFTVIDGSVLNSHPNQQTLTVSGSSKAFVAYGRTDDVRAWLGDQPYANLTYNAADNVLSSKLVKPKAQNSTPGDNSTPDPTSTTPTSTPPASTAPTSTAPATSTPAPSEAAATPAPNPAGSDLWLEEYTGTDAAVTRMNIPDDVSVIIASDGTAPAPDRVRIRWPVDTATPWAGPLIAGGVLVLLLGFVLLFLGLNNIRRSRGPRRSSGPKMPKLPKAPKYRPSKVTESSRRGRRSRPRPRRRMVAAFSTLGLTALLLSGCSADYWPDFSAGSTPVATPTALNTDAASLGKNAPLPVVTVPQLQKIVAKVSTLAATTDSNLKSADLASRFAGPALALRTANYAARAKNSKIPAPAAIPAGPLEVSLPQATDAKTWPRVVEAVVQNTGDAKQAPIALVLVQQTPRENYLVNYAITLEPHTSLQDLAPASIGTPLVQPDSKFLLMPPAQIASAYEDILTNGDKSKYALLFDEKKDLLAVDVGAAYKAKKKAALSKTASLTFSSAVGTAPPIALATNDSGAIVTVELTESETLKVVESGAEVNGGETAAALTGKTTSKTGFVSTYGYQLMFYVPPAGSTKKITLLGFSQGIIAATELK